MLPVEKVLVCESVSSLHFFNKRKIPEKLSYLENLVKRWNLVIPQAIARHIEKAILYVDSY